MKRTNSDFDEYKPLVDSDDVVLSYKASGDDEDNILEVPKSQVITARHLLVWPLAFLFTSAYNLSYNSFGQYVYIFLQEANNITTNTTTAYCNVNESSDAFKIQQYVQQEAVVWGIYMYISGGLTSVVATFVMGSYTDRFGRKFLFILPCFGTIFRTVWTLIGMKYNFPLYYYLPGYFIEGCTGQIFNIIQISYIYVSDITAAGKQRSIGIVIIELALGLASSFPALAVGFILKFTNSFVMPLYISLGILVFTMFLMFLLPETFPKEVRSKRIYASRFDNLKDSWGLFFGKENVGRRWMYIVTILAFAFTTYDLFGRLAMEGLFLLNYPFCWGPEQLGIFGALRIGFQQVVGMGLVILLHAFMNDEAIAILGCISYGTSFILEAFATTDTMMYIVTAVGVCGLLTIPMLRSIMSKMTSPQKQGAVFAAIAATETGVNLIGAVTSQSIYLATVEVMRGFTFIIFAGFNLISLLLMVAFVIGTRASKKGYYYTSD